MSWVIKVTVTNCCIHKQWGKQFCLIVKKNKITLKMVMKKKLLQITLFLTALKRQRQLIPSGKSFCFKNDPGL